MDPNTALVLQADAFAARSIAAHVATAFPGIRCRVASRCDEAAAMLATERVELFITALDIPQGDVLDLLFRELRGPRRLPYVLVTAGRCAPRVLVTLRSLGVQGLFDSVRECPEQLQQALEAIVAGRSCWSASFAAQFHEAETRAILRDLGPAEQLGLAVIGDGCGDHAAARALGMELSSVRTLRKRIYTKLAVHDKEDMVRAAARLGYTRVTDEGRSPRGLGKLVTEYLETSKRPAALSPALLAACARGGRNPV